MAKPEAVKAGYYVALNLIPGAAPHNCYVGAVKAADEYGIRINLVTWDDELTTIRVHTEDFFAPWMSIASMLVCTEKEPVRHFIRDVAPRWQSEVEAMCQESEA
jgi:hypothetical protein